VLFSAKTDFLTLKFIKFEPDNLASFCFLPLKAEDLVFPVLIIYTIKNPNKNVKWPIIHLSKNHFLSKKDPKKVP
jgi:hypothetical protein